MRKKLKRPLIKLQDKDLKKALKETTALWDSSEENRNSHTL